MFVEYCSLKIFEFTKTNSYGGEDNWVTPRLVTEKARNNPEGKFAFSHIIAPFLRFCKIFCDNLCCLPSERTAKPCCRYQGRGLCRQISLHTYFCNYTLSLSVFLFVLVFDLSILPVYIFSQELLDFVCVFVFVLACWSTNTFLQEDLFFVYDFVLCLCLCASKLLYIKICARTPCRHQSGLLKKIIKNSKFS